jgi:NAD(P)-dependent dehydrogenase (short-subunit alcohol dehydrogenase family)
VGVLDGKVAIVTGSGQGVGRGIALALASEGCRVMVAGRTKEKLDVVCAEIAARGAEAIPFQCDVGFAEQIAGCVQATLDQFGTIDILVNNAQVVPLGRLLDVPEEAFAAGWDTGPLATFRFMRACHPHLKGGGSIVNLGTGAALRADPVGYGA